MISISNASKKPDTAYAQIPVWLIRAGKEVTPGALKLYAALKTYTKNGANHAFPSQETLADDIGVSSRQVRTYMQQLKDCGGVRYQLRRNEQGKKTRNYEYMLAWDRPFTKDEEYRNDTSAVKVSTGTILPHPTGTKLPLDTGRKLPTNYTHELHPKGTTELSPPTIKNGELSNDYENLDYVEDVSLLNDRTGIDHFGHDLPPF